MFSVISVKFPDAFTPTAGKSGAAGGAFVTLDGGGDGFDVSGGFAFLFVIRFRFGLFAEDRGIWQQGGVNPFTSLI